jgi:hypothetical protein
MTHASLLGNGSSLPSLPREIPGQAPASDFGTVQTPDHMSQCVRDSADPKLAYISRAA